MVTRLSSLISPSVQGWFAPGIFSIHSSGAVALVSILIVSFYSSYNQMAIWYASFLIILLEFLFIHFQQKRKEMKKKVNFKLGTVLVLWLLHTSEVIRFLKMINDYYIFHLTRKPYLYLSHKTGITAIIFSRYSNLTLQWNISASHTVLSVNMTLVNLQISRCLAVNWCTLTGQTHGVSMKNVVKYYDDRAYL